LTDDSIALVYETLRSHLQAEGASNLVGVTCLARGADQVFARAVLDIDGVLSVIIPAKDYRERKVKPDNAAEFDELISKADSVDVLPFPESNREAYMAASEKVLDCIDKLVAVWDGQPSGGHGGTADVVDAARQRGIPVVVIWPQGVHRE
jgi:hypothetical protein